jgi:hypothetical protein
MIDNIFAEISKKYPFITLCAYAGVEYVGIIQNRDDTITTIYDFGDIQDPGLKRTFLDLANTWWWESNHSVPINIFLKKEWEPFRRHLKTFSNRDLKIIYGPVCSLQDISRKKNKRKSITMVKRMA